MDRITKSLLDEFSRESGLDATEEHKQFAHFATYLAVTRHLGESFDTEDLVVESGGDTGIDAIGILVNGALVADSELVEELAQTNGFVDATFIFVQAERSAGFETSKIGQFGFGVVDFFNDKPTLPRNEGVKAAAEIMTEIYKRSGQFKRGNPICRLFYITTGRWTNDRNLEARRQGVVEDLQQLGLFREIEFLPVGADGIQRFYNQTKNAISREFTFADKTVIPEMPGVKEAYLGLLPASEFIGLLDDGSGSILKSIFYDNVRDWQEYNPVNSEIALTLESPQRARFALMNNGITIIAKTLRATGNRFHIEDYQIVNGCQTSHVLFDNRAVLDASVVVPLRLIATEDDEISASIVKATNRQTEVREEQLLALSDFQKKLEAFFLTFEPPQRLFYERRSRQYNAMPGIEKTRVVTPSTLIRAYASIFLEEPHRTTRTYRALLQQLGKSIFGPQDRLEPYYYAAAAYYRMEFLFRRGFLNANLKTARYHILMAVRMLVQPEPPPRASSHEMTRYTEPLIAVLWDDTALSDLAFAVAADLVKKVAKGDFHRDRIRTQPFTEEVKKAAREMEEELKKKTAAGDSSS